MSEASPKRILYYCQSLVGIGHLTCSLRIIQELLGHAEVDLVQGGLETTQGIEHPRFRNVRLPTLLHDSDSGGFYDPDHGRDVDVVWAERAGAINGFLRDRYDAIVFEFYPFGRRRFKDEIKALLAAVKASSGPVPVFTSVREVLVPRALENDRRMVESVKKLIHTVFVRSDPDVIHLRETFSLAHEIEDRLVHTGYIGPPAPGAGAGALAASGANRCWSAQGGGATWARELLRRRPSAPLPGCRGLHFLLAAGSRAHTGRGHRRAARQRVQRQCRGSAVPGRLPAVRLIRVGPVDQHGGRQHPARGAGQARTRGLAYPYQANPEQGIRIRQLCGQGTGARELAS